MAVDINFVVSAQNFLTFKFVITLKLKFEKSPLKKDSVN